jgi:hypothetical protein
MRAPAFIMPLAAPFDLSGAALSFAPVLWRSMVLMYTTATSLLLCT